MGFRRDKRGLRRPRPIAVFSPVRGAFCCPLPRRLSLFTGVVSTLKIGSRNILNISVVNQGSLSPMSSSNSSTSPRAPGATRPANAPQQSKVDLSEIFPETPPKKTLSMPRTLTGVGKPATLSSPPTERPPQPPSAASSVSPRGVANRPHSKAVNADELHRRSVSVPETVTQATLEVVREYSANNSTSANATTARSPPVQPGKKITDILGMAPP